MKPIYYSFEEPFDLTVQGDKNNQIHDIHPRIYKGVDLFSKYHNRPFDLVLPTLIDEMYNLTTNY